MADTHPGRRVIAGIVLFRTSRAELERCLRSLRRQILSSGVSLDLAFMDNDEGHDRAWVEALIGELNMTERYLTYEQASNPGFGEAHNRLFRKLLDQGRQLDYYLCVNPDGLLHRDCVAHLVEFAQAHEDRGLFEARQFPVEHPKPYDPQDFTTAWCSGCLLLVPREVFHELGGFDPAFFMYCEDVDLSWRARLAGYPCYTVASALIHHYVFDSRRDSDFEQRHMLISGFKLARKFGSTEFEAAMRDDLSQKLAPEQLRELLAFKPARLNRRNAAVRLDFHHGFHFAQGRW